MTWLRQHVPIRPRKLIVFLLLGATVNVALAWGCTMWSPTKGTAARSTGPWPAPVGKEWPEVAILSTESGFGFAETQADGWLRAGPPEFGFTSQWSFRAGWPWYATYTARSAIQILPKTGFSPVQANAPSNLAEGIATRSGDGMLKLKPGRFLPTLPVWSGFLLNTLFFATVLSLPFVMWRQLRRIIRIHRGRCSGCGYQIGTSPVCTECGVPVSLNSE